MVRITLLRSKIAKRILVFFIVSAVVPIMLFTIVSLVQGSRSLEHQGRLRLHQDMNTLAMSIFERLLLSEANLTILGTHPKDVPAEARARLQDCFSALASQDDNGKLIRHFGDIGVPPKLHDDDRRNLAEGRTIVRTRPSGTTREVLLCQMHGQDRGVLLWGIIKTSFLLGVDLYEAGYEQNMITLYEDAGMIFSALPPDQQSDMLKALRATARQVFSWKSQGTEYLSDRHDIFLKSRFGSKPWTLVLSEPKAHLLRSTATFKQIFLLSILATILLSILVSANLIRRSLEPLERLSEGTTRIAGGDYVTKVEIASGDEFEALAHSFNAMMTQIDTQFKALDTLADIDRAILSTLNTERIIEIYLERINIIFPSDGAALCLFDRHDKQNWHIHARAKVFNRTDASVHLYPEEIHQIRTHREYLQLNELDPTPAYLKTFSDLGIHHFLILPITLQDSIVALAVFAYETEPAVSIDVRRHMRQVIDRVAVALRNAYLIEDLNELSIGTITALARAVDAKSPWTSGHSERVSLIACEIAKKLALSEHELEVLRVSGLLHDIGKINTPRSILDKQSKLEAYEYRIIQDHPRYGARILEPLQHFAEMIPIVLQHHERYDGLGYPKGLSGKSIVLPARILAVADAYDAMTSDRPYRQGMQSSRALEIIVSEAGSQFDPDVVKAFLARMQEGEAL